MPTGIRILFIIDYFHRTGGTEKHLAQLITGLPADVFSCAVLAFDLGANPLLDGLRDHGVPVISFPVRREYVPHAFMQAWRLSRLIQRNRYDIVQTMHQKADTYGALIARFSGTKILVSSKRDTGQLRRPWHRFLNRRLRSLFDAYIVVAQAVRTAVPINEQLPPERIVTIYNGVDTARFTVPTSRQRSEARARFGLSEADFVVGMVAGFRPEKDYETFFAAMRRVLPGISRLKILAVGAGPLLSRFREQVSSSQLGGHAIFTGDVADVVPCLWSMDIACLTPRGNEGFSNAVIEQMATGLPVVVTNVGGNAEAVVDGESGKVIPAGQADALAQALLDLYAHPARREAMGQAARRRAAERFSLDIMCAQHASLYKALYCQAMAVSRFEGAGG